MLNAVTVAVAVFVVFCVFYIGFLVGDKKGKNRKIGIHAGTLIIDHTPNPDTGLLTLRLTADLDELESSNNIFLNVSVINEEKTA